MAVGLFAALMGLFFTLFYVFSAYVGAPVLFGSLVQYHIEIVLALLTMFFSLPSLQDSELLRMPQTYGAIGLSLAVTYSVAFNGWLSGAPSALFEFLPNVMVFFFVALNCKKKIHLQWLIGVLLAAALYTICRGYLDERAGVHESLYIITMINNSGAEFFRIRGATFLNDPNDLAQFLVMLIPCLFFFWKKGSSAVNLLLVYIPICVLFFGMYLTHSRGGMIALMAVAVVAGRRKFGLVRSAVVGVILFVGLSVAGFSGGRDVGASSGEDRMDAWAAGLQMIRAHPFKGVGFHRFTDFHELTAHNMIVLCAAELGLPGFFFWVLFVVSSVRDVYVGSEGGRVKKPKEDKAGKQLRLRVPTSTPTVQASTRLAFSGVSFATAGAERLPLQSPAIQRIERLRSANREMAEPRVVPGPYSGALESAGDADPLTDDEVRRLCSLMLISFAGFLCAGWFLARSYTMTLFLIAGMGQAVYRMARERKICPQPLPLGRAAWLSACTAVVLILLVWLILRADHL
jgi:O-antigen ligase